MSTKYNHRTHVHTSIAPPPPLRNLAAPRKEPLSFPGGGGDGERGGGGGDGGAHLSLGWDARPEGENGTPKMAQI